MYYLAKPMLLAAILITSVAAQASTIYNNGTPNEADGLDISAFIAADNFALATASTLTGATFFASADVDPFTSQFSGTVGYGIFTDGGGAPGTLIASGYDAKPVLTDTGVQIFGTQEYEVTFAISSVALAADTTYWLGLHENAFGTPDDGTTVYWDTSSSQTGALPMSTTDLSGASGWYDGLSEPLDLSFQLQGASAQSTPEPSAFLPMLVIAIAAIVVTAVRKSSRQKASS